MIVIAAIGKNHVIGSGAGMPWNVPAEYAQFLDLVRGQTVIIGRRSWEIFGPDLTSENNVVVSRSAGRIAGAHVADGIEPALEIAAGLGRTVFSAGGARIYEQTVPLAEAMYLSYIKGEYDGDAWFPRFEEADWNVAERRDHADFEFVVYRRKPGARRG